MNERTPRRAYLEIQRLARDQGRNSQQLFEIYIHESFLARLAESRFAELRFDNLPTTGCGVYLLFLTDRSWAMCGLGGSTVKTGVSGPTLLEGARGEHDT